MDNKMYRVIWDETTSYVAYVDAPDLDQAYEVWGTGIQGEHQDLHISEPSIMEV